MEADERSIGHESYELKWGGDSDAEDLKNKIAREQRENFAFCNAEGKCHRDLQAENDADESSESTRDIRLSALERMMLDHTVNIWKRIAERYLHSDARKEIFIDPS